MHAYGTRRNHSEGATNENFLVGSNGMGHNTQCRKAPCCNVVVGPETGRSVDRGVVGFSSCVEEHHLNQADSAVLEPGLGDGIVNTHHRYPLRPGSSSRRRVAPEEDFRAEAGAVLVYRV